MKKIKPIWILGGIAIVLLFGKGTIFKASVLDSWECAPCPALFTTNSYSDSDNANVGAKCFNDADGCGRFYSYYINTNAKIEREKCPSTGMYVCDDNRRKQCVDEFDDGSNGIWIYKIGECDCEDYFHNKNGCTSNSKCLWIEESVNGGTYSHCVNSDDPQYNTNLGNIGETPTESKGIASYIPYIIGGLAILKGFI